MNLKKNFLKSIINAENREKKPYPNVFRVLQPDVWKNLLLEYILGA